MAAGWSTPWVLLSWLTLPLALRVRGLLRAEDDRERLHRALKGTSALHGAFGLLLAAALLAERWLAGGGEGAP
jgi:1,4-dihydroxy-2-naphthoate octaprenyltransferase